MKLLLISLFVLSSLSAHTASKISCDLVDDFDSYAIEVLGDKAAFFDNDNWFNATYSMTLESMPSIDVFESNDSSDPFTIYINEFPSSVNKTGGSLTLKINGKNRSFDLTCKKVKRLIYFK